MLVFFFYSAVLFSQSNTGTIFNFVVGKFACITEKHLYDKCSKSTEKETGIYFLENLGMSIFLLTFRTSKTVLLLNFYTVVRRGYLREHFFQTVTLKTRQEQTNQRKDKFSISRMRTAIKYLYIFFK